MMYAFNETYDSALKIPIEIRKWLLERYNKEKEKENKNSSFDDTDRPLTNAEKMRFGKPAQQRSAPKK